jgi:hypothetical protein
MNNLIKKINYTKLDITLEYIYINIHDLINLILSNPLLKEQNKKNINDIKEYNDRQKIILNIFINEYSNLYQIVSKYNKYISIESKSINLLNEKPIFRGFYNASNIIKLSECDLNKNILQIGILPTFIESIYRLTNSYTNLNFIRIKSFKKPSNQILYDSLINKFKNYNLIDINNFYYTDIQKLINNPLLTKYDVIIFDTYKNMYNKPIEIEHTNINLRYILSIIDSKYILLQIIFALNKLNNEGTLILLLPGYNHIIYQQFITILGTLFNEILLVNCDFDYSYRYFLICKNFKPDDKLINELTKNINNDILINILNRDQKILDINFSTILDSKFNKIYNNISIIENIYNNKYLINKIYDNHYNNQLNNTNKWLKLIFNKKDLNKEIKITLSKIKDNILIKLQDKLKLEEFKLEKLDEYTLNFIGENIDTVLFSKIIHYINYFILENIVVFNNNFNYETYKTLYNKFNKTNDINLIIDTYNLNDPLYLEYSLDINIFDNIKNQLIIKFDLYMMSPLFLSILYILTIIYKFSYIIRLDYNFYYLGINNKKIDLTDIIELYNLNKQNINKDYQIIIFNENFIEQINKIFSKLFLDQFINIIRYKFLN